MKEKLILASNSPRRRQLLELAGIDFEVIAQETDESYPEELTTEEIAMHIALQKALVISKRYPQRKVLAADTIVVLDQEIIGKPQHRNHAIEILKKLSGKTHQVITAVVMLEGQKKVSFADTTSVTFNELSESQIIYYVDTCKPYDKAGAYAIQEWIGAIAIKRIEGCFYNVMGLPVSRLIPYL